MNLLSTLDELITDGVCVSLPPQTLLRVTGQDAYTFLQGQFTQNLNNLTEKETFYPCSRLSSRGLIKFNFFIKKIDQKTYQVLCLREVTQELIEDLEKFIISEDVSIVEEREACLEYRSGLKSLSEKNLFSKAIFGHDHGSFFEVEKPKANYEILALFGMYSFFFSDEGKLISNSISATCGLDLGKGCFVGQEVVSKIENNRGGAEYPFLVLSENDFKKINETFGTRIMEFKDRIVFSEFKLKREFRVHQSNLGDNSIILDYGKLKIFSSSGKSHFLFLKAVDLINKGERSKAKEQLEESLRFYSKNLDALEALGVVSAELGDFEAAHQFMDKIIEFEPKHVMARANKSLFYMREGKIDEAEREKEISTKLSMDTLDKELESEKIKKINNQREMYLEVLEIDSIDKFALEKYIELSIDLGDYSSAREKIDQFLKIDPENPKANLFNCKDLKFKDKLDQETLDLAKKYAAKKNDKKVMDQLEKILV